jgi:Aromatic-ring-opening dioxygenase LigAB, LigA subunit
MSLYSVQKLLFGLNRDREIQTRFRSDLAGLLNDFELTDEERHALTKPDIGLLYVLGVNGQILMHFAAFSGIAWPDYLEAMRRGIRDYGPVRAGIYAMTTSLEEKVAGL